MTEYNKQNVQALKRELSALRAQLLRYQTLFTDAPDGYLLTDHEGTVQAANRRAAALFNVDAAGLAGQALVAFLDEAPQLFQERLEQFQTGQVTAFQNWKLQMRRGKGPPFIAAAAVNVMTLPGSVEKTAGQDRAPAQLCWVLRDVTRDELLAKLSACFVNVPFAAAEDKIKAALRVIGVYSDVDHSYLVLLKADDYTVQRRYAWVRTGLAPLKQAQSASLAALQWSMDKLTRGEGVCVPRVADLPPDAERRLWERDGVQSILALPLLLEGELVGFLGLSAERAEKHWTVAQVELMTRLAEIFSNMLACKRGLETLRQRNQELALLNRAGQVFSLTLYLDQVLVSILEETYHVFDALASSIWLTDLDNGELVCWQATSPYRETVLGWRMAPDQGLVGWVAQHGESLIVPDALTDPRYYPEVDACAGLTVHAILSVPLRSQHRVVGVLQVVDGRVDHFRHSDLQLVESLATTAAIAIENAQLYEQSRQEAETRSTLLREVNHRVKNNLAAIIGLLYTERRHGGLQEQPVYQAIIEDLIRRVQSLSTVHKLLSAHNAGWAPLRLSELAAQIIDAALQTLPGDRRVTVDVPAAPVHVTPDQAHHLALLINELATNAAKYALQGRDRARITFRVVQHGDTVRCEFRDDGPGYPEAVLRLERYNVGFTLIQKIVRGSLGGELALRNDSGAVALIQFENKIV